MESVQVFALHLLIHICFNHVNQLVVSPRGQYSEYVYI